MKPNDRLLWAALAVVAVLVPILLSLILGSPWYLLVIVVLLAAIGALWLYSGAPRQGVATPAPRPELEEPAKPPAPLRREVLPEIELPTARPDYSLVFSAVVMWEPNAQPAGEPPHADLPAAARNGVVERAASFIRDRPPSDVDLTKNALAAQLGEMVVDSTGSVSAQAANVELALREDDRERLREEAVRRKVGASWHQEREHERHFMDYLQGDVLTTPGRALVWWLAQHPGEIQGAVDRIGQLNRLSAVSQGAGDPAAGGPQLVPAPGQRPAEPRDLALTRGLLLQFFPESPDKQALFARGLARLADESGQEGYGRRIRDAYGLTPGLTQAAAYLEDQAPPDPEEEPPYPDDADPTTA